MCSWRGTLQCLRISTTNIGWIILGHYLESRWVAFGTNLNLWEVSHNTILIMSHWKSISTESKMITIRRFSILLRVVPMKSTHMPRLQRSWRRYLATRRLGALESRTPGETPLKYKLQTTINRWNTWIFGIFENWSRVGFWIMWVEVHRKKMRWIIWPNHHHQEMSTTMKRTLMLLMNIWGVSD